jgi:hypothetical protein
MTFAEEFTPERDEEFEEEANYPTAFGITFTPQVSGIALAVLGLIGAIYIWMTFGASTYDNYQKLKADESTKQEQVNQKKSGQLDKKLIELDQKLQQATSLKSQILALFSNPNTLDTLLLDVNGLVQSRKLQLISFQPQEAGKQTIINDGSLGPEVNNKLKRQSITLQMEGNFQQTQSVLRDLERLQPLLLVNNLTSEMAEEKIPVQIVQSGNNKAQVIPKDDKKLKTSFTLDIISPLTPEELAKLTPPPAEGKPNQTQ